MTRVGFEPDLAGLKDQQPHQKSNEPVQRLKATGLRLKFSPYAFSLKSLAFLLVDREVLEPSSPALQASAIPSQLPVHLYVKRWK